MNWERGFKLISLVCVIGVLVFINVALWSAIEAIGSHSMHGHEFKFNTDPGASYVGGISDAPRWLLVYHVLLMWHGHLGLGVNCRGDSCGRPK
jgi:hypothetical protein